MTAKEELHRLVDELPEVRLDEARQFLKRLGELEPDDEPLDAECLTSLDRGLADIRAGRVKALREYERERGL